MSRIQKVSTYLIWVFNFILVLIPIASIFLWVLAEDEPVKTFLKPLIEKGIMLYQVKTPTGMVEVANLHLSPLTRCAGLLGDMIALTPLFLGILWVKRLFQNYRQENIFSLENALLYKRLGWLFILNAFVNRPLSEAVHTFAVTFGNPPGQRYISIGFGTPNLEALLCGVLVLVISWVMIEAYKLQEDKNLTI